MTIADLLKTILGNEGPFWAAQFEAWVRSSRRYRAFAETYHDKIHKKLRTSQNEAGLLDLFFELETAYRLLQDPRFVVEYEKHGLLKERAPDFTVAFRVNTIFNLEVTRLRTPQADSLIEEAFEAVIARKLTDLVGDKLGQMRSGSINFLLIVSNLEITDAKLLSVMNTLRLNAEQKKHPVFAPFGFQTARDFLHQFQLLSAISCRNMGTDEWCLWSNSLVKTPVPKELLNAFQKTLMGQSS
ncbi:MAG: hypothetical protein ABI690_02480 [Chloroflexota bacterium]